MSLMLADSRAAVGRAHGRGKHATRARRAVGALQTGTVYICEEIVYHPVQSSCQLFN